MVESAAKNSWRIEVNDPYKPNDWRPLWTFNADGYAASEELVRELNRINYPIRVRIASDTD
jgi:hypothetical protein